MIIVFIFLGVIKFPIFLFELNLIFFWLPKNFSKYYYVVFYAFYFNIYVYLELQI